jgi:hypothetical protein
VESLVYGGEAKNTKISQYRQIFGNSTSMVPTKVYMRTYLHDINWSGYGMGKSSAKPAR